MGHFVKSLIFSLLVLPTISYGQNELTDLPHRWKPNISKIMEQVQKLSKYPSQSSLDLAESLIEKSDSIIEQSISEAQNIKEMQHRAGSRELQRIEGRAEEKLENFLKQAEQEVSGHINQYENSLAKATSDSLLDQEKIKELLKNKSSKNTRVANILSVYFLPTYACRSHGANLGVGYGLSLSSGFSRMKCESLNGDSLANFSIDGGIGAAVGVRAAYSNRSTCQVGERSDATFPGKLAFEASIVGGFGVGKPKDTNHFSALIGVFIGFMTSNSWTLGTPEVVSASVQDRVDLYISPDTSIEARMKEIISSSLVKRSKCSTHLSAVSDADRLGVEAMSNDQFSKGPIAAQAR